MDSEYLRFVLALILVLGLILLLAWVLRRFGFGGVARPGGKKRLQVVDSIVAGPRHRLVLVRRDQTEHLLLLGPTGDLVVESPIHQQAGSQPGTRPAPRADTGGFDQALAKEPAQELTKEWAHTRSGPTLRAERPDEGKAE